MALITIDYTSDSNDVVAVSGAHPGGEVANMFDIAFGHRCLYKHAKRLNQRRILSCPICGARMEILQERYSYWVYLHCAQCRLSSDSAGSEDSLRKGYENWAAHIRSMIYMGREASE